ncbi:hypothetical protein ALO_14912, partial [Acetonema longum DSM 6540]
YHTKMPCRKVVNKRDVSRYAFLPVLDMGKHIRRHFVFVMMDTLTGMAFV